ncbi:MAG: type II toxin-antitoxin system VapC family toxin [Nitrospirae bacterium]|nr:type II toxin-antitoxin system VapC family toxin [Nitrospirota bacterium]
MTKYIIDSDLYIELIRTGRYHNIIAEIYIRETPNIYFSSVVAHELLSGVIKETGRKNVEAVLIPFEKAGRVVTPGYTVWKETGYILSKLRSEKPHLKSKIPHMINDALIAMSARSIGATVVTLNSSDFDAIKSVRNFSYITV